MDWLGLFGLVHCLKALVSTCLVAGLCGLVHWFGELAGSLTAFVSARLFKQKRPCGVQAANALLGCQALDDQAIDDQTRLGVRCEGC